MDLELLRCFRHIVEFGSVTKAASDLGISQPALTRQIKRLEQSIGSELLVRNSRGVQLTEAGELLLTRTKPLLDQAEGIAEELSAWRGALSGDVALCMPASLHRVVTYPLVLDIRRSLPGIRLRVIDGFDALLHEQLRGGLVDLGILVYDEDRLIDGVDQKPLLREPLRLIGPRGTFPDGATVRVRDLHRRELVLPGKNNSLRQHIDALFLRQGKPATVALEVDSMRLISDLIARDGCLTITPASGAEVMPRDGISSWPIAGASIVWARCVQKRRERSPVIREIVRRLDGLMLAAVGRGKTAAKP